MTMARCYEVEEDGLASSARGKPQVFRLKLGGGNGRESDVGRCGILIVITILDNMIIHS